MNSRVLMAMLAIAVPACAAGTDAGEFLVDPGVAYAATELNQLSPAAASDSVNSLIVWADERNGSNSDIYGTRLDPHGAVLDRASIAISTAVYAQHDAAVAYGGTGYLVAWADRRGPDSSDIYAARVTSTGGVLDPEGIAVSTAAGHQGTPAVAFDGSNWLVVWADGRSGDADIYGARVTGNGVVLDPSGVPLVVLAGEQASPAAVYDGTNILIVWEDAREGAYADIYGARLSPEGAVLDSGGFVISAAPNWQGSPEVARGVDNALVVWHDMRVGTAADVYGCRVTRAGEVLDSAGIGIATGNNYQCNARVTFDGTQYLVAWKDQGGHGNVFAGRVGGDGRLLDPQGFRIPGGEYASGPAAAFDGEHFVVAWYDVPGGTPGYDIAAARVGRDGVVLDPQGIPVSNAAGSQRQADAAFGGTDFLVVWGETRARSRDIYGVRLTAGGAVVDSTSIRISPAAGDKSSPAVTHGMRDFLVVWEDGAYRERNVGGARVAPDGSVLDSAGIAICGQPWDQFVPVAASDGTDYLVAWQDRRNGNYDIYGARVSAGGVVLDTAGIAVGRSSTDEVTPALAGNGTDYLVLWQVQGVGVRDVYGARISRQGVVLDPDGFVVSDADGAQEYPAVASGGTTWLAVWSDQRNGDYDIYAARVSAGGVVLDTGGILVCGATGAQRDPAVAYDGIRFVVAWQDERAGEQDIHGARVTQQGAILDTFVVTTQPANQYWPALARGPGEDVLAVYSGWTGTVEARPYNSLRIWGVLSSVVGTEDRPQPGPLARSPAPSVVRGVLWLGALGTRSELPGRNSVMSRADLLDAAGRTVMVLAPGPNDVSHLAPGVYFVRERDATGVRRVVLVR